MRTRSSHWVALCALVVGAARLAHADTLSAGDPANLFTVGAVVSGLGQPTSFAFLPDGRLVITDKLGTVTLASKSSATAATFDTTKTIGTFQVNTISEQGLLHQPAARRRRVARVPAAAPRRRARQAGRTAARARAAARPPVTVAAVGAASEPTAARARRRYSAPQRSSC